MSTKNNGALIGTAIALTGAVAYAALTARADPATVPCTPSIRPPECTWLDEDAFRVFSAMVDTIIPEYSEDEIDVEQVREAVDIICPGLFDLSKVSPDELRLHHALLRRGAIEDGVDVLAAVALQNNLPIDSAKELSGLFKVMSTSAGNGLVTGFFAPYYLLSREKREIGMRALRDAVIPGLRAAFQTVKRVTGSVFLSRSDRGVTNELWPHLRYAPEDTLNSQDNYYQIPRMPRPVEGTPATRPGPAAGAVGYHPKVRQPQLIQQRIDEIMRAYRGTSTPAPSSATTGNRTAAQAVASEEVVNLEADVVVVGSGSGGGMLASELVKAGLRVVVLEKGGYFTAQDDYSQWREMEAFGKSFERGGMCSTKDGNISVLAGSCVGGGSAINWCASFRTPDHIVEEWNQQAGGRSCFRRGGEFSDALDAVHRLLNINTRYSHREVDGAGCCGTGGGACAAAGGSGCDIGKGCGSVGGTGCCGGGADGTSSAPTSFAVNDNNRLLWRGAAAMRWDVSRIPRNVKHCVNCGSCCNGCSYNSKQSTIGALLEPLGNHEDYEELLSIVPRCYVERVLMENEAGAGAAAGGRPVAVGVEGRVDVYDESLPKHTQESEKVATMRIRVKADVVVSSAGALHTPALLLRSGLKHRLIGKNLTLHPVIGAGGYFPDVEHTKLYSGVSMGVVVKPPMETAARRMAMAQLTATQPSEDNMEFALETPPAHLGILGLVMPWVSGLSLKAATLNYPHLAIFIALPRDVSQEGNCITIDSDGQPVVHYTITDFDRKTMMAAFEAQCRVMRAAGSHVMLSLQENTQWLGNAQNDAAFEEFIRRVTSAGLPASTVPIFSAHQMSSCRMGSSEKKGPVSLTGETWECNGLYVADASLLPTSLGVNPMVTVEALAYMVSRSIMHRLHVTPVE